MLRFFESSLPSRVLVLFIVWIFITITSIYIDKPLEINHFRLLLNASKLNEGLYMYTSIYDTIGVIPVYINAFFLKFTDYESPIFLIISSIILFLNAVYFNNIVDKHRLINERSYLPALFALLFSFIFYQQLSLTSILIGNVFVTLSVSSLLKTGTEDNDTIGNAFKSGMFMGVAFLCNQIFIVYMLLGIIGLQYYTSKGAKTYINLFTGFTFPIILLFMVYLFFGFHNDFLNYYIFKYFFNSYTDQLSMSFYTPWLILAVFLTVVFLIKKAFFSFKNYISKSHQLIIFWLLISIISIFLMKDRQFSGVYLLTLPLAFMASFFFIKITKNGIKEALFLILIGFLVGFNFLLFNNPLIDQQVLNKNIISASTKKYDGKVLVLDNDPSLYYTNDHGSAFTNWELEKKRFFNINQKGNLEHIYLGVTYDYPKYIIDPNGIFERIQERIPLFKKEYKKVDAITYRRL